MTDAILSKLKAQAFFVCRLEQSWPEMAVNIDCEPNYTLAQRTAMRKAHPLLSVSSVNSVVNIFQQPRFGSVNGYRST
jgi:hypothetical protein